MNNLFEMLGSLSSASGGTSCKALLFQAFMAFTRGEDPKSFLQRMANQVPELKGVSLDNLQGEAERLCQRNGTTMESVAERAKDMLPPEALK